MGKERPRALLLTQYYRPELLGSGPFCADLAEWLVQRGWEVTVIAGPPHYPDPDSFKAERENLPRRQIVNGVLVHRVRSRIPRRGSAAARIASEASYFLAGLKLLLKGQIKRHTLVISLCPSILGVALGTLMRRTHGRHVAIVHDIQSGLANGLKMVGVPGLVTVMRLCERLVLNRVDLAAVLTLEMADQLRQNGVTTTMELLPIWVDLDRFASAIAPRIGPVRISYSGNFGRKQGLEQIVAMAEVLQVRRPDLQIVLRGKGTQAETIARIIAEKGLGNVSIEEPIALEFLHRGLTEVDVHLVPQAPDAASFALPSKIYNIMAAGRPFVATAGRSSPLWGIQQASGAFVCVPPNDPTAFAEAVLRLVDNPALRATLGDRGRRYVARNNARSTVLEAFEARIFQLGAQ